MQFITSYELSESMWGQDRNAIVAKITQPGLFPPEGVNVLRWDSTANLWGLVIFEADTNEQVLQVIGA